MDKSKETIKSLGFSDKEAEIYLKLLELGNASYTDLAKSTGIKRTSLYTMVSPLRERGVVNYDIATRKLVPETPDVLFAIMQTKILQFHKLIPQLKSLGGPKTFSRVRFYSGPEQMKRMFLEKDRLPVPKKDRVRLVISDVQAWNSFWQKHDPDLLNYLPRHRKDMGYSAKVLFSGQKEAPFDKESLPDFNMEIKFLPESYKHEFDMEIRPNIILLTDLTGEQPYGIKIISTELAKAFTSFFNFTWDLYR